MVGASRNSGSSPVPRLLSLVQLRSRSLRAKNVFISRVYFFLSFYLFFWICFALVCVALAFFAVVTAPFCFFVVF